MTTPTNKKTEQDAREREWLLREKYDGLESDAFFADVERLEKGEPLAYVIGFVCFLGARIDLSKRTLIPRAETEYWVEKALADAKQSYGTDAELRMLDIFSGSGCIGLAALLAFPNAIVDFAELEPNALEQIHINLALNKISPSRYRIFQSDIWSTIPLDARYDVVFANPPYIDKSRNVTDASVMTYEPHAALFAENQGMQIIEKCVTGLRKHLKNGSLIFMEYDDDQTERLETLLRENGFLNHAFFQDQFGLWRWMRIESM